MSLPLIGVVTVTYNSASFLDEFVASCAMQTGPAFKVYCIDNDSRDGTPEMLKRIDDPRWVVTLNKRNVGVAEGNNQGIVQAFADGCEWVLLLNNDTTFPSDFFAQLVQACAKNDWRVVVPKIWFDEPAKHIWYGGGGFNARRAHTGFHSGIGDPDVGQFDRPGTVDYSPTCAMLVHRSVFDEVGLMDETYFVYFDDTDFCWRLRLADVPIGYWPETTLVHKVGGSTGGKTSPFTAQITARNRLYYLRKHFGGLAAALWTPVFLLYYFGRYVVRSWNPACFKASLKGTFAYKVLQPRVPDIATSIPGNQARC
jgi:GT2 family glycosyltransferase